MDSLRHRLTVTFFAASWLLAAPAAGQVEYHLRFDPEADEPAWQVEARLPGRGEETIDFWIPRWTAGAYHLADFGRFVRGELEAADESGQALAVERDGPAHFAVRGAAAAKHIVLRYQAASASLGLYADRVIDVEANRITDEYAYVNPPSVFGFVPARVDEPVTLTVGLPPGWKAATVLERAGDGGDGEVRFRAPSYYRFEDSPLLFSPDLVTAEFEVEGKAHAVSAHGRTAAEVAEIAAGCRRIVEAGARLMQGLPYDRYHFLFGFVNQAGASGLEHSFSTLILVGENTSTEARAGGFWGIVAHEYFHLWCAERIHVQALERPDYTEPFATGTLWVNEGITEYMARHVLLHAGFESEEELLDRLLAAPPVPARGSWTDVSRAATEWKRPVDLMQFALRMYQLGPRTILGLDLAMRRASGGERGVLDLLRLLRWAYVERGRGFAEDEMPALIDGVAAADVGDYYRRHIDGAEAPDIAALLEVIGYRLEGRKAVPLAAATQAQLAARRDFFSATGKP